MSERARTYILFAIVVIATAIGSLTQTAVNAMLQSIQAEFNVTAATSQWLTTIYMLGIGITVPIVTFLSRRWDLRILLIGDQILFGAGTIICWTAFNFAIIFVGRILQAIAAGITLPLLQTIAMTRFPHGQNATAMGISGIALGFAPNCGPLVGGFLIGSYGWRSFFAICMISAVVLILATVVFARHESVVKSEAHLDLLSLFYSTLGFGGLLLGFSNASSFGFTSLTLWIPVGVGALFLLVFVLRQRRIAHPLINMAIFGDHHFRVAFVAQNCLFASFMGITLIIPLFIVNHWGGTPIDAGLVFLPATIMAMIVNPLGGFMADKIGTRPVAIFGSFFYHSAPG